MQENKLTRKQAQEYWTSPPDSNNAPHQYADDQDPRRRSRSEALLELFRKHISTDARILEVGCNAGRNLKYLHAAGYRNLAAIEISETAIDVFQKSAPDSYGDTEVMIGSAEDWLKRLEEMSFDVIFTMAVLVHIHPDSDFVLSEIARCCKKHVIVIEDEKQAGSPRHYLRNYRDVFETLGFRQVEEICPFPGVNKNYVGRVFVRV